MLYPGSGLVCPTFDPSYIRDQIVKCSPLSIVCCAFADLPSSLFYARRCARRPLRTCTCRAFIVTRGQCGGTSSKNTTISHLACNPFCAPWMQEVGYKSIVQGQQNQLYPRWFMDLLPTGTYHRPVSAYRSIPDQQAKTKHEH